MRGLYGHDGILPVADLMANAGRYVTSENIGASRFLLFPTLFWFGSSDPVLVGSCIAGVIASMALLAGIAPAATGTILWVLYMSFVNVGRVFMGYQWDALLVEAGFLAIVVAPYRWRDSGAPSEPRAVARWLIWWLLFRLMLGSGIVKLASGDPTWRNLTALSLHYETQPLPTPLAWYAWLLPLWFHKAATASLFVIELVFPWLIAGSQRMRAIACGGFVALQLIIAATGNYAFFNLLTIALSLTILDDAQLGWAARLISRRSNAAEPDSPSERTWAWPVAAPVTVAILTVPVSVFILASQARVALPGAALVAPIESLVGPFRVVNPYGLFAVMTTTRPELTVEGTADGIEWKPYVFKHKPSPARPWLSWVAPHQPRLDWQMWFAALGDYDAEPWFSAFRTRLLAGSPDVIDLLAANPFPDRPPMRVRVTRETYRFATRDERRQTASVWRRKDR